MHQVKTLQQLLNLKTDLNPNMIKVVNLKILVSQAWKNSNIVMERQFKPEFLKKMGECMLSHSIKPQRHRRHSAIAPQNSQFLLLIF